LPFPGLLSLETLLVDTFDALPQIPAFAALAVPRSADRASSRIPSAHTEVSVSLVASGTKMNDLQL
jgi:hypothetical protein